MLQHDRFDITEGNDLAKSNKSKECMIYHYWFFNHGFKFHDSVHNDCHDLTMLSVNISDITIITVKNNDYCIIHNISKSEVINLLESAVLEKSGYIQKNIILILSLFKTSVFLFFVFCLFFCSVYIKWLILWTSISL